MNSAGRFLSDHSPLTLRLELVLMFSLPTWSPVRTWWRFGNCTCTGQREVDQLTWLRRRMLSTVPIHTGVGWPTMLRRWNQCRRWIDGRKRGLTLIIILTCLQSAISTPNNTHRGTMSHILCFNQWKSTKIYISQTWGRMSFYYKIIHSCCSQVKAQ